MDGELLYTQSLPGFMATIIPQDSGFYTLSTTATRSNPFTSLGTRAEASWTFLSKQGQSELPLIYVRASGYVNGQGVAPAGVFYPLILDVEYAPEAPTADITDIALDVSYDDGVTWEMAKLLKLGSKAITLLRHPADDGFVSLRTSARDAEGNSVNHTTVRAYEIGTVFPHAK